MSDPLRAELKTIERELAQLSTRPFPLSLLLQLFHVGEVACSLLLMVASTLHHLRDPRLAFCLVVFRFGGPCLTTRHRRRCFVGHLQTQRIVASPTRWRQVSKGGSKALATD